MIARIWIAPVHLLRPQVLARRGFCGSRTMPGRRLGTTSPFGLQSSLQRLRTFWRTNATKAAPKPEKGIKALVKEYGYSALGVYLFLSMLDLPLCYMLVHSLGKERIEVYENKLKQTFGFGKTDDELRSMQEINKIEEATHEAGRGAESGSAESLIGSPFGWFSWTEFVLAYGIHKSLFIFVRVPLTAALTPSIVKMLRGWGFKIGTDKLSKSAVMAKETLANVATASNPKFGTRATKKNKWLWFL